MRLRHAFALRRRAPSGQLLARLDAGSTDRAGNILKGGAGNDRLTGTGTFEGGTGDDTIVATTFWESDTFIFNLGDGKDTISRYGVATDTLVFGAGIAPSAITVARSGGDMVFKINASDQITVKDWFNDGGTIHHVNQFQFADGTTWDVNAVMVRDNELAQGSKSLRVPPDANKISIELTPSKPQFKPGEAGVYTLLAKDFSGKPISAEFSVGIVDEAIYAVRPEGPP